MTARSLTSHATTSCVIWSRDDDRARPVLLDGSGPDHVAMAVRGALTAGAIDGRAVAVLARRAQGAPAVAVAPLSGLEARLRAHDRPVGDLARYDQLRDLEQGR